MSIKSKTCFGRNGALTQYDNKYDAQEGAKYANEKHGRNLIPYECQKCKFWHLSPKERQTPSEHCEFCDKALYPSEEDAKNRAAIIYKEQGKRLTTYECPHQDGWHLTSKSR